MSLVLLLMALSSHTDDSAKHKKHFQKKIDGSDKLYHQSIRLIEKGAKGSEMVEDMQGYRFKALIAASKYNVSTEGIAGLCKDWVDEYAGCNFGDPTDAVSIASTP